MDVTFLPPPVTDISGHPHQSGAGTSVLNLNPPQPIRRDRLILAVPAAFLVMLVAVDMATPSQIRLSDILFVEPIVAAWFSGPMAAGINWILATAAFSVIML